MDSQVYLSGSQTELTPEDKFFLENVKDKFEEVKMRWVTDYLDELDPLPAAILDVGKVRVNCQRMLDATQRLGLLWRPHVKTHKVKFPMLPSSVLQLSNTRRRPYNSPGFKLEMKRLLL